MNLTGTHRQAGLFAALLLVLDQISKHWILNIYDLPARGSVEILPFFNLTMVWNRGISMGLFEADGETGTYVLIGATALITVLLMAWFMREGSRIVIFGLAAVIGGSIGNIVDRVRFGAVADFLHLHAFGYSFYVFNVADAAITMGVALLLWDALLSPQKAST